MDKVFPDFKMSVYDDIIEMDTCLRHSCFSIYLLIPFGVVYKIEKGDTILVSVGKAYLKLVEAMKGIKKEGGRYDGIQSKKVSSKKRREYGQKTEG